LMNHREKFLLKTMTEITRLIMNSKKCQHTRKYDLTHGLGLYKEPHWYCPDCKWHKYQGKEYMAQEWEERFQ
jgi:ribosomal protein L32